MILFLWAVVLLVLKFYCRIERVGCASGGDVVDVKEMKKVYNLDKFERKQRIRRNWRVQNTCLLTCITLLPCTFLMIKFGLDPFIDSLHDVQQMNDRIDSHAYRGIQTLSQLHDAYNQIQYRVQESDFQLLDKNFSNTKLDLACVSNITKFSSVVGNLTKLKQNNPGTTGNLPRTNMTIRLQDVFDWTQYQEEIKNTITNVSVYDFNGSKSVLYQLTNGTTAVDTGIDAVNDHDWLIRLLVVIMDVVVIFMIVGILFVKDNIDYPVYQSFTSYILLPFFCTSLFATIIATYIFTTVAVLNAGMFCQISKSIFCCFLWILTIVVKFFDKEDFCSGGNAYGYNSPLGTIREVVAQYGYASHSLPYRALQYYEEVSPGAVVISCIKITSAESETVFSPNKN